MSEHNPKPMNKQELEKYIEKDFLPSLISKFPNIPDLVAENATLKAEVERLRKAGDAVALDYAERIEIEAGETAKTLMKKLPVLREWNAAKEGKPSV